MDKTEKEIQQLKAEVEYYKRIITWYRDTYENRSIVGVVKDKVNKKLKSNLQKIKMISPPKLSFKKSPERRIQPFSKIDKSSFYATHAMDDELVRIGVFVHLFYQDLWPEINTYLKKIGINFDLLMTLNEEDSNSEETIKRIKEDFPHAIILKVPNKGLDIGPFFELINYAISRNLKFDYVLKFHTKKSLGVNAAIGEMWRKKSYESLFGSQGIVFHILRLFKVYPEIGMIGPYESKMSTSSNDAERGGNANKKNIDTLSKRLDINDKKLEFFGGTMFWVKWSILEEKFRKKTLTINDFEPGYKKDELLSHAMERLLASLVRDAGYNLYELTKINDYIFYKNKKKKICWIHPGFGIGGGNRVIFEIAQAQSQYYDVYSISFMGHPFNNWIDLNHNVLSFSTPDEARYFIETLGIDYVFATGWQTVDFVKGLSTPQKKFYFIQDYEPWFADADSEKAKLTYKNSFTNIVIAEWLKEKLATDHKLSSTFVKLGTRLYNNSELSEEVASPKKVLIYFKLKSHHGRGSDLILELLKKLVKHNEIEINVFGHEDPNIKGIHFHGEVHKDKLLNLYRNNHLFVDLSRHRGIATIALEVAQFGVVPLLSNKNFGLEEYGFVDGVNCLFVDSVDDAYKKLLLLISDDAKYIELRKGVKSLGKTFNWEYTVNDFNQITDLLT